MRVRARVRVRVRVRVLEGSYFWEERMEVVLRGSFSCPDSSLCPHHPLVERTFLVKTVRIGVKGEGGS